MGVIRPCFCQHAAGQCIYDLLKMFPPLTSLPARAVWRSNARVTTTVPKLGTISAAINEPTMSCHEPITMSNIYRKC
ncbi:hypothetical protein CFP56_035901 [Quercus suber]|uniref:Uncharacterized protein n=1 Tax=Quercus suber TaxID=58331 RepID=A0AAW0JAC0_QUESU